MTIGVSIVHFLIKVPKLVQMIVTIYRVQSSIHCQSKMTAKYTIWPPRNLVLLTFQHQTTVISCASSRSPCSLIILFLIPYKDGWCHSNLVFIHRVHFRIRTPSLICLVRQSLLMWVTLVVKFQSSPSWCCPKCFFS